MVDSTGGPKRSLSEPTSSLPSKAKKTQKKRVSFGSVSTEPPQTPAEAKIKGLPSTPSSQATPTSSTARPVSASHTTTVIKVPSLLTNLAQAVLSFLGRLLFPNNVSSAASSRTQAMPPNDLLEKLFKPLIDAEPLLKGRDSQKQDHEEFMASTPDTAQLQQRIDVLEKKQEALTNIGRKAGQPLPESAVNLRIDLKKQIKQLKDAQVNLLEQKFVRLMKKVPILKDITNPKETRKKLKEEHTRFMEGPLKQSQLQERIKKMDEKYAALCRVLNKGGYPQPKSVVNLCNDIQNQIEQLKGALGKQNLQLEVTV